MIDRLIYYDKGLADTIMEAERFHDPLSANWRLRKANSIVPNQVPISVSQ